MTTSKKASQLVAQRNTFYATREVITPEVAQKVLDNRNVNNRPIHRHHVEAMSDQILSGDYEGLNGQTISFDTNGNLHDGQQRLAAIARAGVPVEALVVYNVAPETRPTVDVGRKRTVADELAMRGENNAVAIASILMMMKRIELDGGGRSVVLTSIEAIRLLDENPDVRLAAETANSLRDELSVPASVLGYCTLKFNRISQADNKAFWDVFTTGQFTGPGDSRFVLQKTLFKLSQNKHFTTGLFSNKIYQTALVIKAWNAFRKERDIHHLRWSATVENFPEAI